MNKPMMLTTDLALRFGDPEYNNICQKFLNDFEYFSDAFARAWFKLTHRDMGPRDRYLGSDSPEEILVWQDPVDIFDYPNLNQVQIDMLRDGISSALVSEKIDITDLIFTAWVSASTYRNSDKRGGANGARVMLEPMKSWKFTDFDRVEKTVGMLCNVRDSLGMKISVADLIVLGGNVGVEIAGKNTGHSLLIPFVAGRGDARQEQVDTDSFAYLEPVADGFLNWTKEEAALAENAEHLLIDRASLLSLTPPEMVVLMAGFRSIGVTHSESVVFSKNKNKTASQKLSISVLDSFGLDSGYKWQALPKEEYPGLFYGENKIEPNSALSISCGLIVIIYLLNH
jgi:catalase-peroxidase